MTKTDFRTNCDIWASAMSEYVDLTGAPHAPDSGEGPTSALPVSPSLDVAAIAEKLIGIRSEVSTLWLAASRLPNESARLKLLSPLQEALDRLGDAQEKAKSESR